MNRWLSFVETCLELRLSERSVRKLLRQGQLVGYRLPRQGRRKWGEWRILDPGHKFARYLQERQDRIEHVPLVSSREFAEIVGMKPGTIRQLKRRQRVKGERIRNTTLYPVSEVRRFLVWKELGSRRAGRKVFSPILIKWLTAILEKDDWVGGNVLDNLLRQALPIPEPQRSKSIAALWDLFDQINGILQYAREFQFQ